MEISHDISLRIGGVCSPPKELEVPRLESISTWNAINYHHADAETLLKRQGQVLFRWRHSLHLQARPKLGKFRVDLAFSSEF